jgi:hypothetical protein
MKQTAVVARWRDSGTKIDSLHVLYFAFLLFCVMRSCHFLVRVNRLRLVPNVRVAKIMRSTAGQLK